VLLLIAVCSAMSFKHNPVDEALSASKSLKILETTPTGADFDARVRITAEVSGVDGIYVSIDSGCQDAAVRAIETPTSGFQFLKGVLG
jgi:hypothetical protein